MIPIGALRNGDLCLFANCLSVARLTLCEYLVRARLKRRLRPLLAAAAGQLRPVAVLVMETLGPDHHLVPAEMAHSSEPGGVHQDMHHMGQERDDHQLDPDCPIHMYFFPSTCVVEMFSGQRINDLPLFIGYLGAIVIAMILYEILKLHRDVIFHRAMMPLEAEERSTWITWFHFYQTVMHALQLFSSYLFMLLFMTFNVWICLAVVLGVAIGYFLVGWRKTELTLTKVTDDCCY